MGCPYQVQTGRSFDRVREFKDFRLAFGYYRGWVAAGRDFRMHGPDDCARIVNIDNIDGADDAKPWAQLGLTEAEWDEVQGAE